MEPVASAGAGNSAVFVGLEFSESRPVHDIQRVSALIVGLMNAMGISVDSTSQSSATKSRIETSDYMLRLSIEGGILKMGLKPKAAAADRIGRRAETVLARLVRAMCPVLLPARIIWNDTREPLDTAKWLSRVEPVQPRQATAALAPTRDRPKTGRGVAVWPNRPHDFCPQHGHEAARIAGPDPVTQRARYEAWKPQPRCAMVDNRSHPEPMACRASAWTLTGVTAALCPPAGASMAVLNIGKGANLRLNLHALTLTLIILSLYQSGALAITLRTLGL